MPCSITVWPASKLTSCSASSRYSFSPSSSNASISTLSRTLRLKLRWRSTSTPDEPTICCKSLVLSLATRTSPTATTLASRFASTPLSADSPKNAPGRSRSSSLSPPSRWHTTSPARSRKSASAVAPTSRMYSPSEKVSPTSSASASIESCFGCSSRSMGTVARWRSRPCF